MNDGIQKNLEDLKDLVEFLEFKSEEIKTFIETATLEEALIIKKKASMHMQATYGIFETLETTADKHAEKLLE